MRLTRFSANWWVAMVLLPSGDFFITIQVLTSGLVICRRGKGGDTGAPLTFSHFLIVVARHILRTAFFYAPANRSGSKQFAF